MGQHTVQRRVMWEQRGLCELMWQQIGQNGVKGEADVAAGKAEWGKGE